MGWLIGPVVASQVVVYGSGNASGVFVYNGVPKNGNPPIFYASSSTKDPYNNTITPTVGIQGTGLFFAENTVISTSGFFQYASTPAAGNPPILAITTASTDPFGNNIKPGDSNVASVLTLLGPTPVGGTQSFIEFLATAGLLQLLMGTGDTAEITPGAVLAQITNSGGARQLQINLASPQFGGFGTQLELNSESEDQTTSGAYLALGSSSGNQLFIGDQAGSSHSPLFVWNDGSGAWGIGRSKSDTTTSTNANGSGQLRISAVYTIYPVDMTAGTVYELEVPYAALMEGQQLGLSISLDGGPTQYALTTIGGAIVGAGDGILGTLKAKIQILTTGTGGTFNAFISGSVMTAGGTVLYTTSGSLAGQGLAQAIDTTVSHTVRINSLWNGAAAGQTVSGYGSTFTRKGI